jgi:WD40 repeat protein
MFVASADPDGIWSVHATDTDDLIYEAPEGFVIRGVSWDGERAFIHSEGECDAELVSTVDGSVVELVGGDCFRAFFSPDGRLVYVAGGIFDTDNGELLGIIEDETYIGFEAAFTPDGSKLVLGTWLGSVYVFDVALLLSGASVDEAIIREIPAHDTGVLKVSVSPDGSMLSSWSWTEPFKVWDLDTGQPLGQFGGRIDDGTFHGGDFHPSLPQLIVTTPPNEVRIHTLDIDELIAIAAAGLSRDMTEAECEQYLRRSCEES